MYASSHIVFDNDRSAMPRSYLGVQERGLKTRPNFNSNVNRHRDYQVGKLSTAPGMYNNYSGDFRDTDLKRSFIQNELGE